MKKIKEKNLIPKKRNIKWKNTKYIFIVVFTFISSIIIHAQPSHCSAELKIDKNRNVRSSPPDGTFYKIILKNNSSIKSNFKLTYSNVNSSCNNPDGSSTNLNCSLSITFFDINQKQINEITLNNGETTSFFAKISVPAGTPINTWCCSKIIAQSTTCNNYDTSTIVHTLVINPKEN